MKKKISIILAFIMMIACVGANAQLLYEKETQEIVTGGVVRKNIVRFYGDYALNINCITADLKNENLIFIFQVNIYFNFSIFISVIYAI